MSTLDHKTVHDLLTPLNAIIGFSGIVIAKCEKALEPKQLANLKRIEESGRALAGMIRALGTSAPIPVAEPVQTEAAVRRGWGSGGEAPGNHIATSVEDVGEPLEVTPMPAFDRRIEGLPRVLVVDDVASSRELLRQDLGDAGFDVRSQASGYGCLDVARLFDPTVIILDIDMPGMDGIETCRRLKSDPTTAHIPVLFLTGQQDEETAVVALAAGGNDFLHKPYSRSIMLARVSSQVAIHEANARLRRMVITDALTGVYSRRFFYDGMRQQVAALSRSETPVLSCLMLDVDHFKSVNDRLGHVVGDRTLARVGEILRETVRAADIAARFGGEEFVVGLPGATRDNALGIAEKVRAAVESGFGDPPNEGAVTVSIGVSSFDLVPAPGAADLGKVVDRVIQEADEAMYRAKRAGRNRVA